MREHSRCPAVGTLLVHNGEVYNYLELAAELRDLGEQITTGTDTEVILAAYDRWGLDAVSRFNGIFAFGLWDGERQRLLLARDRMGVKPLYLRRTRRSLAFASEPTAFIAGSALDSDDCMGPRARAWASCTTSWRAAGPITPRRPSSTA